MEIDLESKKFATYEEIIELLKNHDCEIYTHRHEITGKNGGLSYSARVWEVSDCKKINRQIHHATIKKLQKNKIIMDKKPYLLINPNKVTQ